MKKCKHFGVKIKIDKKYYCLKMKLLVKDSVKMNE